ncbi:MAG: hypothetical protein IJ705_06125, partial [Oscillospiraceae bacterium]|nr:hypothetical protein [Oscillospiraceae bacterium]
EDVPRAFRDEDAAYRFMGVGVGKGGEYDQWSAKLQPEERKGLYDYTRQNGPGNFRQVNTPLRNYQPLSPERTQQVEAMDRGISKSNLNQPMIVHRGSGAQLLGGQTDPKKIMKMFGGRTVKDKGFLSTSALKKNKFNGDIYYRITVTSGKGKGSFLAPMSRHKKENEYLVKRNAPMIVRDAYKRNGQTVVDLEVLDEEN